MKMWCRQFFTRKSRTLSRIYESCYRCITAHFSCGYQPVGTPGKIVP